uniref:Uncharacterized protein n=1 Tax=Heterorhabditis bacteriophora TaxID=37862 RepID=A0A1I7WB13_HETBA
MLCTRHERDSLNSWDVGRRLNSCISLLVRQCKKNFCGKLLVVRKNGSYTTILNAHIHG